MPDALMPVYCLSCGYREVPGEDFDGHDCVAFLAQPTATRQANLDASMAEARRRRAARNGIELIAAERRRQVEELGFDAIHDAGKAHALALAGAAYAASASGRDLLAASLWPWAARWWTPSPDDPERALVKAGALIAAAIDALPRGRA